MMGDLEPYWRVKKCPDCGSPRGQMFYPYDSGEKWDDCRVCELLAKNPLTERGSGE